MFICAIRSENFFRVEDKRLKEYYNSLMFEDKADELDKIMDRSGDDLPLVMHFENAKLSSRNASARISDVDQLMNISRS